MGLSFAVAASLFLAQEPDEAGQRFLDKVAKGWSEKLPTERLMGFYIGRKWIGHLRVTIKAAQEASGAAFDMTMTGEMKLKDQTRGGNAHVLLARNLSPVWGESVTTDPDKNEKKWLTTEKGRWKLKVEENGKVRESEGDLKPGTTWAVNILTLFAVPDDDKVVVLGIDAKKGPHEITKAADKQTRTIGRKKGEYRVLESRQAGDKPDLGFYTDDGRMAEIVPGGSPTRLRPIMEADLGKDLDEPLELKPCERALVDAFLAVKRDDSKAVLDCFDFDRMAAEMAPGYADMTAEKKKEAAEELRKQIAGGFAKRGPSFPEEKMLEEALAAALKTTEKDGVATIDVFGREVWKLYLATEGDRKGRWLIIRIDQK